MPPAKDYSASRREVGIELEAMNILQIIPAVLSEVHAAEPEIGRYVFDPARRCETHAILAVTQDFVLFLTEAKLSLSQGTGRFHILRSGTSLHPH